MNMRISASLALILLLAACARGEDAHPIDNAAVADNGVDGIDDADFGENGTAAPLPTDAWIGKWIGVEGLILDVQPSGERGRYVLSVTLLDGTKSYDGTADGDAIRFTRDGRPESIRAATGDQTGLKWLAGKQNCLMIQQGEGFCRDNVSTPLAASPIAPPTAPPAASPGAQP